jgi:hypothetical protein
VYEDLDKKTEINQKDRTPDFSIIHRLDVVFRSMATFQYNAVTFQRISNVANVPARRSNSDLASPQ